MNKLTLLAGVGLAALLSMSTTPSANAALITLNDTNGCLGACEGLTYILETQATADPLTNQFALVIAGENVLGTDTRFTGLPGNGRTGINAIAFNLESNQQNTPSPTSGKMDATLFNGVVTNPATAGWNFVSGGLGSTGCDGSGGQYCFDNLGIPPTPTGLLTGPIILVFEATLLPGHSWADYTTGLKIDWVGSENNYSLVSKSIPVNDTCPDCTITPTVVDAPEPASLALLGTGIVGMIGLLGWRRRRENDETAIA